MFPLLLVPALIQPAAALPPGFTLPQGLRMKPDSYRVLAYDLETFEIKLPSNQAPLRVPVKGRTWRFIVESAGVRAGILSLQQTLRPALEAGGWVWQWEQRGVARRSQGDQDCWLKVSPSGSAALQVVMVQPGLPRTLSLTPPGRQPEVPAPEQDFPYLTPWPGAILMASTPPHPGPPIPVDLGKGEQGFVFLQWIEKEYALPDPPSAYEFRTVYGQALTAAGWELEGDSQGGLAQLQAAYFKDGRDVRLILRLVGDAMAVSVADVGLQRPR